MQSPMKKNGPAWGGRPEPGEVRNGPLQGITVQLRVTVGVP